ncbi:MAG: alkyl sulfatase BDS1-like metallo-beta-lactamase superfamily hydrolase [Sulfurimonas sp.]|jgi:alkyl sulfatase BDS1-like metallo-beta-lactamase superfamily hydrolase
MKKLITIGCVISMLTCNALYADTKVEPELALKMLNQQSKHFEQRIVQTAPNVYTAVGFHGANTSMIVGDDGVIIVDTLMGPTSAGNALKAFRKYSDKPVKAIIYTHSHGDHTGGAKAFMQGREDVALYSTDNFGYDFGGSPLLKPLMIKRGIRQFGRKLPSAEATNRGIAAAKTIDFDRGKGYVPATVKVKKESLTVVIAGVEIQMIKGAGETDDALFIWLPKEKVIFSGDNFYQAFPNLYAVRGTPYRDVMNWSRSDEKMATYEPEYLIPGHTSPIIGKAASTQALKDYAQAIKSVYDQTIKGMNEGKGPELIAQEVKLPQNLSNKPYLTEFYGSIHHSVRAIYVGLIGWFDGNPTTLTPLHPKVKAQNMAKLVGGVKELEAKLQEAMKNKEYQWALELADNLKWLDDANYEVVVKAKIKALRALAEEEYNAPNRNYYLTYAHELEDGELNKPWF